MFFSFPRYVDDLLFFVCLFLNVLYLFFCFSSTVTSCFIVLWSLEHLSIITAYPTWRSTGKRPITVTLVTLIFCFNSSGTVIAMAVRLVAFNFFERWQQLRFFYFCCAQSLKEGDYGNHLSLDSFTYIQTVV